MALTSSHKMLAMPEEILLNGEQELSRCSQKMPLTTNKEIYKYKSYNIRTYIYTSGQLVKNYLKTQHYKGTHYSPESQLKP